MLGRHADHFMLRQARERISAVPSNAKGQSMPMVDRERAGTQRFTMASTIRPGPDNVLDSGDAPGAEAVAAPQTVTLQNGYYPGAEALQTTPMGNKGDLFASHLDGLGEDPIMGGQPDPAPVIVAPEPFLTPKTIMLLGGLAAVAFLMTRKKSRK
jgi:hypothetical protein